MELGNFSVSLAVKDLSASRAFYEKLGFTIIGGDADQGWLIMKSPTAVIGLFQGMFEKNLLTFNPGWDENAQPVDGFTDIREIQNRLKEEGIEPVQDIEAGSTGPANIVVIDPDGNPILIDQHV